MEGIELEPHPVSGEVEIDDVRPAKYRRLDEETLQARLEAEQFDLLPVFVWCEDDQHGDTGAGWKLAEMRSMDDLEDGTEWYTSVLEANEAAGSAAARTLAVPTNGQSGAGDQVEDDDDDYWASYDRTPGRGPTPANGKPAAGLAALTTTNGADAEQDYYSRYGAEVQPALDAHDPDEDHAELGESTLNGDSLVQQHIQQQVQPQERPASRPTGASMFPADPPKHRDSVLEQPRAISRAGSQSSIEKLEKKAAEMGENADRAQTAIKTHISTDVKSLFRLAKSTGMDRQEFERIVKTELECLAFMEEGE